MMQETQQRKRDGAKTESAKATEPVDDEAESLHEEVEHRLHDGHRASSALRKVPSATIAGAAGLGLLAASVIGVGEVAIAGAAGYAAYRWLTRSKPREETESESEEE